MRRPPSYAENGDIDSALGTTYDGDETLRPDGPIAHVDAGRYRQPQAFTD